MKYAKTGNGAGGFPQPVIRLSREMYGERRVLRESMYEYSGQRRMVTERIRFIYGRGGVGKNGFGGTENRCRRYSLWYTWIHPPVIVRKGWKGDYR